MSKAYTEQDDESLYIAIRSGDKAAFNILYDRYWERLFAYTYNRLHLRGESEEIVQDVFLSLWERKQEKEITTVSAYLYRAARNKLLNFMRSQEVRRRYASDFNYFRGTSRDDSNNQYQDMKSLELAIENSLTSLPKRCRQVYKLSREEHLPIKEISSTMNISRKTVENYLTQALKHLRSSLGDLAILFVFLFV